MNKLINRINSASTLGLDSNSLKRLNRIKSQANLDLKGGKIPDIQMINIEIDKLYELWNEKQELHNNINKRTNNIVENKKVREE
jgi:hypothetical protein